MNDEEVKLWKQKLLHAHNEWRAAGWIPDDEGGNTEGYSMLRYLNGYRGVFPEVLRGGAERADQMVGNIFFSIVNTMVTQNSGRTPDPILRPLGGAASGKDGRYRAWLNEQVVRTLMREGKYKRDVDTAVLCAVITGAGFVRHGFTPEIEYEDDNGKLIPRYKNHTPDMPWIQALRPWQIRIDPVVNDFSPDSEPRWCAFQNLHFKDQIERNPNLIMRKDLTPTHHKDLRPREDKYANGIRSAPNPDDTMPMYEEWTIYDFEERRFFGISDGSTKLIREESDWIVDYGQLPYSYLAFNPQIDSPFPIPFPELFYSEQIMYNKIWTILNAMVSRTRRILAYAKDGVAPEQEAILTNPQSLVEAIAVEGTNVGEVIKDLGFGSFDGQLLGLLFQLKEQIREVLGVSSFDRGQRANVETASEANQIGAGAELARSRNQEKIEGFWQNIIRVSHRSFLQNPESRERLIPIIGEDNLNMLAQSDKEQGFFETSVGDLLGEFDYAIRANSTMKIDPAQRFASKATLYNLLGGTQSKLLNQRYFHETLAEEAGEDPRQAVMSEEVIAQQQQADQGGEGGEGAGQDAGGAAAVQQGLPDLATIPGGRG